MRLPLPRAAALAIPFVLVYWGQARMALGMALSHVAYLRPSELLQLRGDHIVAPSPAAGIDYSCWGLLLHDASFGRPGMTGDWDASVLIDLDLGLSRLGRRPNKWRTAR